MTLQEQVKAVNETIGKLNDGVDCNKCLNKGYYETIDGIYIESHKCECMKQRMINRQIKASGLADSFEHYTLDRFTTDTPHHRFMKQQVQKYIAEGVRKWFVVAGQIGSGKTHICTALSKFFIERGMEFRYLSFAQDIPRLTSRMKSGYIDVKDKAEIEFDELKNVKVLYIDDYLKDVKADKIFELINYRYADKSLITIISSEKTLAEQKLIDEATASRIYERCGGYWIDIKKGDGKNYRFKE